MSKSPDLSDWNYQVLMLVQALVGAVSANFRMVSIGHSGGKWLLRFFLQEDTPEDREEIEDILTEFDALQDHDLPYEVEVHIGPDELPYLPAGERVVYRRREV